ncbi:cysteine protease [Saccharomyces pastorianus]|uniref:Cysteine protease RIM13 n=1 Tax=Saccharomyces pastorianus TaxID=27292 RepID=A0A6C1EES1_SACPS|nr:cysteine protease [Saccharomyces pastorianus]
MDDWREFNSVIKSVHCNAKDTSHKINSLVDLAIKSENSAFIKAVLNLKENSSKIDGQKRFLWLTSTVNSKFYPPISISEASPLSWNENEYCVPGSEELQSRYSSRTALRNEGEYMGEIEQCQDVSDCSLVASLINLRSRNLELPPIKQISPNEYQVNLCFNGSSERLVTVDTSQIPTSVNGKQLSLRSKSISDKISELALLLVVQGTYSTDGSNISIDTYYLSGFLPEIIGIDSFSFEKLWKFFKSGLCLIGVGTGNRPNDLIEPLLANHDYSVVDIRHESGVIKLRDPSNSALNVEISYEQYLNNFKQLYLNWNHKKLFGYSQALHIRYDVTRYNKFAIISDKPLFHIVNNSKETETVWILLENHLSKEGRKKGRSISFINQARDCIIYPIEVPANKGTVHVGLQLMKLKLAPGAQTLLYCHSTTDNNFSIHLFSVVKEIFFQRLKDMNNLVAKVSFSHLYGMGKKTSFDTCSFFENPTFQLEVQSERDQHILMDVTCVSKSSQDFVNIQVYYLDDYELIKPIMFDNHYQPEQNIKQDVPILTNTKYIIVCSTYGPPVSSEFQLVASTRLSSPWRFKSSINLREINMAYGSYPYQCYDKFYCKETSKKFKILISLQNTKHTTNKLFIRVAPVESSAQLRIRCNVFEPASSLCVYECEHYRNCPPGGVVIPDLEISCIDTIVLMIERDMPISNKLATEGSMAGLELFVGSNQRAKIEKLK